MKKLRKLAAILVTLVFLLSFPAAASAQGTDKTKDLSIQEALETANKASYDLKYNSLEVERAEKNRDDGAKAVTYIPTGGFVSTGYQSLYNSYQRADIAVTVAKKTEQLTKDQIYSDMVSAYASAIKARNTLESARISLDKAKQQRKISSLAASLGMVSDYDMKSYDDAISKLETAVKSYDSAYQSSVASLADLLGISDTNWKPNLTSTPILNNYKRDELGIELSRGSDKSATVWTKKALRDIELSKQSWSLEGVTDVTKDINMKEAEYNYQQSIIDVAASIKSLYFALDAQEKIVTDKVQALTKAENDLKLAKIKYNVGIIPYCSTSTTECLYNMEKAVDIAKLDLVSARADLAKQKANFALLTGQNNDLYSASEWK
ncbi:MAG: TolC family protein [Methylocystaceae bacterium]